MCIVCMREGKEIEYFGIIDFFVFSFIHFLPTNIDMFFYKLNDKIKCNKIIRHAQALHHVHGFSKKYPSVKTILVSQPNLRHPTNLCQYQFSCCNVRTILYPHHRQHIVKIYPRSTRMFAPGTLFFSPSNLLYLFVRCTKYKRRDHDSCQI